MIKELVDLQRLRGTYVLILSFPALPSTSSARAALRVIPQCTSFTQFTHCAPDLFAGSTKRHTCKSTPARRATACKFACRTTSSARAYVSCLGFPTPIPMRTRERRRTCVPLAYLHSESTPRGQCAFQNICICM